VPPLDIDAFVLHPLHGIEKICRYNRAWLDHIGTRSDCLVITYEELRKDPSKGFQRVLDFWGDTSVSGAHLADLSSFEKMKLVERQQSGPSVLKAARCARAKWADIWTSCARTQSPAVERSRKATALLLGADNQMLACDTKCHCGSIHDS
jgi:hypothetical protein